MNRELLSRSPKELWPHPGPIDFAEIRNPLGPSPLIGHRIAEKQAATEESLSHELACLWKIPQDMIVIGRGSTDLIDQIPALFLSPDALAVLPVPTYFGLLDKVPEHKVVQVPLSQKNGFLFTSEYLQSLDSVIREKRPGLVWLCSPNNPTGIVIPGSHIEHIAKITPGLVVVDEAYQELVDPTNKDSAIHLIHDYPNIIVTRTFSKAYGLPEIHVGMAVATPEIAQKLRLGRTEKVDPDSFVKASAALLDQEHIWKTHRLIYEETKFVWHEIHNMERIEMGAQSRNGVCIIRHRTGNLWRGLSALGVLTTDFNQHRGLNNQRFVRLGLLDHAENTVLIEALKLCDALP